VERGYCESAVPLMQIHCAAGCAYGPPDLQKHCKHWAALGECARTPAFMLQQCPSSCAPYVEGYRAVNASAAVGMGAEGGAAAAAAAAAPVDVGHLLSSGCLCVVLSRLSLGIRARTHALASLACLPACLLAPTRARGRGAHGARGRERRSACRNAPPSPAPGMGLMCVRWTMLKLAARASKVPRPDSDCEQGWWRETAPKRKGVRGLLVVSRGGESCARGCVMSAIQTGRVQDCAID
jgi:hypothetical protein